MWIAAAAMRGCEQAAIGEGTTSLGELVAGEEAAPESATTTSSSTTTTTTAAAATATATTTSNLTDIIVCQAAICLSFLLVSRSLTRSLTPALSSVLFIEEDHLASLTSSPTAQATSFVVVMPPRISRSLFICCEG